MEKRTLAQRRLHGRTDLITRHRRVAFEDRQTAFDVLHAHIVSASRQTKAKDFSPPRQTDASYYTLPSLDRRHQSRRARCSHASRRLLSADGCRRPTRPDWLELELARRAKSPLCLSMRGEQGRRTIERGSQRLRVDRPVCIRALH